mgnify:FL=1
MNRKICTILLTLVLCVSAAVSASARSGPELSAPCCTESCYFCPMHGLLPSCGTQQPACPPASCDCSGSDCPAAPDETPGVPDTPNTPDETPSVPDTPEVPDASGAALRYERAVVGRINAERAKYGLSALTLRSDLCGYARIKSEDMRANGYFSHTSPTYGSPFSMMQSFGVTYTAAGENIAMGYASPEAVVRAWMDSEGHRANILSASYTQTGVGYVADGNYWTQWFIG